MGQSPHAPLGLGGTARNVGGPRSATRKKGQGPTGGYADVGVACDPCRSTRDGASDSYVSSRRIRCETAGRYLRSQLKVFLQHKHSGLEQSRQTMHVTTKLKLVLHNNLKTTLAAYLIFKTAKNIHLPFYFVKGVLKFKSPQCGRCACFDLLSPWKSRGSGLLALWTVL